MSLACTAPRLLTGRITARALRQRSQYRAATTSTLGNASPSPPPRRAVTVTNDTGRVPWSELSVREKAARTTQQSVNLGVLVVAVAMTVGVSYILYTEVFSTESKTAVFNRCTDRIRQDPRCVEILGGPRSKPHDIEAHGEGQRSGWARNRTIAYVLGPPCSYCCIPELTMLATALALKPTASVLPICTCTSTLLEPLRLVLSMST